MNFAQISNGEGRFLNLAQVRLIEIVPVPESKWQLRATFADNRSHHIDRTCDSFEEALLLMRERYQ